MNKAAMGTVFLGILAAAAALLALFLIPTLLEIKRAARSATLTLDAIRTEIRPTLETLQGTLQEHRELTRRANRDLLRIEDLMDQARRLMDPAKCVLELATVLGSVSGVTSLARAGRKGLEIFLGRLRDTGRR